MPKFSFVGLVIFLFPTLLFAQTYELITGPEQDAPWYYRTKYAASFGNLDVYQGSHNYNGDWEFSDKPAPEIVIGNKTNDYFIQIVERNTGTPKSPILYDHRTRDESNASIQLYTHIYEANKDGIVILGIGYTAKRKCGYSGK